MLCERPFMFRGAEIRGPKARLAATGEKNIMVSLLEVLSKDFLGKMGASR